MNAMHLSRRHWLKAAALGAGAAYSWQSTASIPAGEPKGPTNGTTAIDIGTRRELFVDDLLIDRLAGASLRLHPPQPREVVLKFDQPWEGLYSGYETA